MTQQTIDPEGRQRRVVLITGASGGLGKATVDQFGSRGWSVAATVRDPRDLHQWKEAGNILGVRLDLSDHASIENAVAEVEARLGRIDVLVNNAGSGLAGALEAMSLRTLQQHFEANVIGTLAVTKAVLPGMRRRRAGAIVNVTSIAGRLGLPFMAPYVMAKFALEGMAESLRYELAPFGIRVRLVEPSGIRTRFDHAWLSNAPYDDEIAALQQNMAHGMARAMPPDKVARVVYRASISPGPAFRFPTRDARALLWIKALLPDAVMQSLLRASMLKARSS